MDMNGLPLLTLEVPNVLWNPHLVPTTADLGEPYLFLEGDVNIPIATHSI